MITWHLLLHLAIGMGVASGIASAVILAACLCRAAKEPLRNIADGDGGKDGANDV